MLKAIGRHLRREVCYYRRLLSDPRTPRAPKWLLGLAVAYLSTPVDLIPDWIPLHQRPIVIYSLGALLLGAQMLTMGFLAELLVAKQADQQTSYSVAQCTSGQLPERAAGDTAVPTVKFKSRSAPDAGRGPLPSKSEAN